MTRPLFPDRSHAAFLFDMDGTLLSSIAAAERVWTTWAHAHGVDVARLLATMHGRRAIDTIAGLGLPGVDAAAEAAVIEAREIEDVAGIAQIPGAARFLATLPAGRWAIVTSAPRALALRRLAAAGLPTTATMVVAEDVARGKPAPDCFLLAARRLGMAIGDCLVFEDAPAGIAAAEAAGADVAVITATHAHPVVTRHPCLANYEGVALRAGDAGRWVVQA
jgi:sugar-phosphatase